MTGGWPAGCLATRPARPRHGAGRWAGRRLGAQAGACRGARGAGRARRWELGVWHGQARSGTGRVSGGVQGCVGRWARGTGRRAGVRAAWARPVHAGWAKLGHCAPDPILTQFLDSVLFLSHFLDTVHEPGS